MVNPRQGQAPISHVAFSDRIMPAHMAPPFMPSVIHNLSLLKTPNSQLAEQSLQSLQSPNTASTENKNVFESKERAQSLRPDGPGVSLLL